jgi:hypothetical protein
LCGKANVNSLTLRHPLPYGRCAAPSKGGGGTLEKGTDVCPAPTQDSAVTSDQRSVSPPSPPVLCGHPRRCATILGTAAPSATLWEPGLTRRRHARYCAPYGLPSAAPSSQHTNGDQTGSPHTATLEAAPGQEHDSPRRPAGTRFARTAINSTALHTILPHVIRTVRHDCKLPPLGL